MGFRAEVWAPAAQQVELRTPGGSSVLERIGDGWFRATSEIAPDCDYGFALDSGEPLPDPRSHWQPKGVLGPSRVVDHDAFPWSDSSWRGLHLASAVVYELHVGTFSATGTLDGVVAHLEHLARL
ncbi:MAG TPA: hypothetical protein VGZ52_04735, partial [Acidimicrobiales bacterium]|nr:hypothetical protein [Acidimicrobiales bacterium]